MEPHSLRAHPGGGAGSPPSARPPPATQSAQWYAWGPPNMQCRLCASCWIYWKKYGGLKTPTQLEGAARSASIGYWVDRRVAGRGVIPLAVAMTIDHCFGVAGLHRIEISIRPENTNSLRVVEKLGIQQVGYAPRFLHIDGEWRDHRQFAITAEECRGGLVRRVDPPES